MKKVVYVILGGSILLLSTHKSLNIVTTINQDKNVSSKSWLNPNQENESQEFIRTIKSHAEVGSKTELSYPQTRFISHIRNVWSCQKQHLDVGNLITPLQLLGHSHLVSLSNIEVYFIFNYVIPKYLSPKVAPDHSSYSEHLKPFRDNFLCALALPWRTREVFLASLAILLTMLGGISVYYASRIKHKNNRILSINRSLHQKNLQLQLEKEEAQTASQAKSLFLANMSHELRTPLNTILNFPRLLMLEKFKLGEKELYLIRRIQENGEYLLNLTNQILDLSKIEAGKMTLNLGKTTLSSLFENLDLMFRPSAKRKALEFKIIPESDIPNLIYTDGIKLQQILVNLLSNAVKFTSTGSVILSVKRSHDLERLQFTVLDTGVGIKHDELDTLFEAFIQTQSGLQSQEGTGLGLMISYKLVKLLGGELTVDSVLGQGTRFNFEIPANIEKSKVLIYHTWNETARIRLVADQPNYKILVADDYISNREILSMLLTAWGFTVYEAIDGQDAIIQWKTWRPHLIFMDIKMPKLDGNQATRKIKKLSSNPPKIIAVTANIFEHNRAEILANGCDDCMGKPYKITTLIAVLTRHLGVEFCELDCTAARAELF